MDKIEFMRVLEACLLLSDKMPQLEVMQLLGAKSVIEGKKILKLLEYAA